MSHALTILRSLQRTRRLHRKRNQKTVIDSRIANFHQELRAWFREPDAPIEEERLPYAAPSVWASPPPANVPGSRDLMLEEEPPLYFVASQLGSLPEEVIVSAGGLIADENPPAHEEPPLRARLSVPCVPSELPTCCN